MDSSKSNPAGKDDPACTCTRARRGCPVAPNPPAKPTPPVSSPPPDVHRDTRHLVPALIRREAQEALGCTEPGMIALAAARARRLAGGQPIRITVWASGPVLKNAQAVGLPGTEARGVAVAAALGAVAGDPGRGLRVLDTLTATHVAEALDLVERGSVAVKLEPDRQGVFTRVELVAGEHRAEVAITGSHTNIVLETLDGKPVTERRDSARRPVSGTSDPPAAAGAGAARVEAGLSALPLETLRAVPFADAFQAVMQTEPAEFSYLVEGALGNLELAERTLRGEGRQAASHLVEALRRLGRPRTARRAVVPLSRRPTATPWLPLPAAPPDRPPPKT